MLVDRIDMDKDGFVTEKELEAWVGHVAKRYIHTELDPVVLYLYGYVLHRYIMDDVMKLAPHYDVDGDGYIKFDEYSNRAFGEEIEGD